jgi:hypothetical protein
MESMSRDVNVFETGSGKWVWIHDGSVRYTSNKDQATVFDDRMLHSADTFFEDFLIYKDTMLAVPLGTNHLPEECVAVRTYIKNTMAGEEF